MALFPGMTANVAILTVDRKDVLRVPNQALRFNPDYTELYHFIGVCQNNLGDFEGAIKSFSMLLDVEPSNLPTRLKLGVAFHNLGMWDKVIALYERILKQNPEYADIHYRLGLAFLGQGSMR